MTAATISLMLKVAPEIYKAISYLIKNGEIDGERFKKIGFAAVSGGAEGFIRGTVSSALTTCCKAGLLGETLKSVDPTIIGTVTVLTTTSRWLSIVGAVMRKLLAANIMMVSLTVKPWMSKMMTVALYVMKVKCSGTGQLLLDLYLPEKISRNR